MDECKVFKFFYRKLISKTLDVISELNVDFLYFIQELNKVKTIPRNSCRSYRTNVEIFSEKSNFGVCTEDRNDFIKTINIFQKKEVFVRKKVILIFLSLNTKVN